MSSEQTQPHKQHDLYKVLGITKTATPDDIRNAFMKKALVMHPDKAPFGKSAEETASIKKRYEQNYLDLQRAYKILANPKAREQYNQATQNTYVELRDKDKRDVTYQKSKSFTTVDDEGKRVFDNTKFVEAFNKTRSNNSAMETLQKDYEKEGKVKQSDVENLLNRRDQQMQSIAIEKTMHGEGSTFDINAFNKMFDHMKQTNPTSNAVQLHGEEPMGLFSGSKGLTEDLFGGITMDNGVDFSQAQGELVEGASLNPCANINISQFRCSEEYITGGGEIKKMKTSKALSEIEKIQAEREKLLKLDENAFIVTQSEIEKQYSELFESNDKVQMQGIAAKKSKNRKND